LRRAEAQGLWRQGRKVEALRAFENVLTGQAGGWWALSSLAQLTLELGRLEQAERAYRALWSWGGAPARFHLARVLERTGRSEEAREAYEEFVYAWRNADPELAKWVSEARQAITRLSSNAEVAGAPRTR
jgi:tetratricopeptide (TPR) repeat protein